MMNAKENKLDRRPSKVMSCGANHATTAAGRGAYRIGRSIAATGRKLASEGGRSPFAALGSDSITR